VPVIAPSARKHGVSDDDMLHALRHPIRVSEMDESLTMFVGPARDGTPIEVGVVDGDAGPIIVHAMRRDRSSSGKRDRSSFGKGVITDAAVG
jgi:hypothetical protein